MRTAAILPVKRFTRAKQRLGASVADPLRRELAEAMVADVLLALAQTRAIELTILVTGERSVAVAARELGAIVIEDEHEHGQPAAAKLGVKRALAAGIERVLCVPGDCPTLDPAELNALLERDQGSARAGSVVVVPDRHGTGTNGLLLAPADAISPSFGPGSCERHRALAGRQALRAGSSGSRHCCSTSTRAPTSTCCAHGSRAIPRARRAPEPCSGTVNAPACSR